MDTLFAYSFKAFQTRDPEFRFEPSEEVNTAIWTFDLRSTACYGRGSMAVHIIGEATQEPVASHLPEPDVYVPDPETAPRAHRLHSADDVVALLAHKHPLVRSVAIKLARPYVQDVAVTEALIEALSDPDDFVFSEAIDLLHEFNISQAEFRMTELFKEETTIRAGSLGTALTRIAPHTLLENIKTRKRLDDASYGPVITALASVGGSDVINYLKKAIPRAQLYTPNRRQYLFMAVLSSGDVTLCTKILGEIVGESNSEASGNSVYASRAALAFIAEVPDELARLEEGKNLFEYNETIQKRDIFPALDEEMVKALEAAFKAQRVGDIVRTLSPLASWPMAPDTTPNVANVARRRQGLLTALAERARDLDKLDLESSALFLAATTHAAVITIHGAAPELTSPGLRALSAALNVDGSILLEEDLEALKVRFEALSSREMRRVHTIITRERFRKNATLERLTEASMRAGHGAELIETAAEINSEDLLSVFLNGIKRAEEDTETALLKIFEDREAEDATVKMALMLAEELTTERVSLAVAKRFFYLRTVDKKSTAQVLLNSGDARYLPLLESRAFAYEPEEAAWVTLSLALEHPIEGALQQALHRALALHTGEDDNLLPLKVELKCQTCHEVNDYRFERAMIDSETKNPWGDPAFVGDLICKACGQRDQLELTKKGGETFTHHLFKLIRMAQGGYPTEPLITPMSTNLGGRKMGLAEALRQVTTKVEASPDAIRPRLERSRIRMILRRSGITDDLEAVRRQDPNSVEAKIIEATVNARDHEFAAALPMLVECLKQITDSDNPPRLYSATNAMSLQESIEDLLLLIESNGFSLPVDLNLQKARRRRREREEHSRDEV